ncbi:MAG: hypothetical protein AB1Z19_08070 [Eubacteriales bacterium]
MENERIKQLLSEFSIGKRIADVILRSRDFSDDEISQVEKLGYIECHSTTAWGDRVYVISENGELFKG